MGCDIEIYRARIGGWAARWKMVRWRKNTTSIGISTSFFFFHIVLATLLIIGGIELNPGPRSDEATSIKCESCKKNVRVGVLCNVCEKWFHLSCQKIKREEVVEETWMCKTCNNQDFITKELCKLRDERNNLREKLEQAEQQVKILKEENMRLRQGEMSEKQKCGPTCVVIGDSMVRHIGYQQPEIEVECYPGIRLEEAKNMIERQERQDPEKIIFHMGTNDIRRRNIDYVMAELYDLVQTTKSIYPRAKIIISGIIRRRDVNWRKVGLANDSFEWVAERLGTQFVDPNSWLDDWDFGRDGVHLNRRGAATLGHLFAKVAARSAESRDRQ